MLTNNAGFNCNAARVIVQHAASPQREPLLAALRDVLRKLPTRKAWYPGRRGPLRRLPRRPSRGRALSATGRETTSLGP